MLFNDVIGQDDLKLELKKSHKQGRVAHSQLFISPEGSGGLPLSIAFARMVIENNLSSETTTYKLSELKHPDLHFLFPTAANKDIKSKASSVLFMKEWREFVSEEPYGNLFDWYLKLGVENKQGKIGTDDVEDLVKKMSLKSYEGGWKVAVIWMAEKLNQIAANKLLKLIEEPPKNTLFIFVCEREGALLDTIVSRCQISKLQPISNNETESYLIKKGVERSKAINTAVNSDGNLRRAIKNVYDNEKEKNFEEWFLNWLRTAFKVRHNKEEVLQLVNWSKTISKTGREVQKSFLMFSLTVFRNALLKNYDLNSLITFQPKTDINFESFSQYVNGDNIEEIYNELENAITSIQANGNPNIIFMDLSLKLTRLIQ